MTQKGVCPWHHKKATLSMNWNFFLTTYIDLQHQIYDRPGNTRYQHFCQGSVTILSTLSSHNFKVVGVGGDGGHGRLGSSFRVQWAGVHKAAVNDHTVSSTTVWPIWTCGFSVRYSRWMPSGLMHQLLIQGYSYS